jgi:hypothetical protein
LIAQVNLLRQRRCCWHMVPHLLSEGRSVADVLCTVIKSSHQQWMLYGDMSDTRANVTRPLR